ncbi:MAG: hypothetical protein COX19_15385 [Desulfobacterales bacterium CG23_combo_of_CG06-09_8_20_14_all_51_8]|nr:MAG: hypothetical protein COX19_15385 [Desulfobacterales bacterium CG23_combo_of_CG06-09_8_20_14_all_51_8]
MIPYPDTFKIPGATHERFAFGIFLILLSAVWLSACNPPEEKNKTGQIKDKDAGIHKTFERGPVSVHLDTEKAEITIADRLNLTVSVIFDEDYDVELPGLGEKLEQFGIVDYHTSQPELTDDHRSKISRSYVLEPFLSGDYKIPPMKVRFREKKDPKGTWHEIETEEITVHVTSLLPENFAQMAIHDIKPPEDLPQSYALWFWTGGIALLLLISGVVVFLVIRKRKQNGTDLLIMKIPAHQQAFDELNALVSENLVEKGNIKEFYHKISDILRRYIENRFHIRASELTTEEFLAGIKVRNEFDTAHKLLLKNFLTHCDLVKFARHQPQREDIQKTFDACKDFILGTQEKE